MCCYNMRQSQAPKGEFGHSHGFVIHFQQFQGYLFTGIVPLLRKRNLRTSGYTSVMRLFKSKMVLSRNFVMFNQCFITSFPKRII